jgi:GDP-4-dehydro-6-deoxy-D-mannose reductase
MQVYITGARGFVGTRLVGHLEGLGHLVTAADRDVDIRDAERLTASLEAAQPDAVVHLAAQSSVAASFRDPAGSYAINFQGGLNVLRAIEHVAPTARLLLVGSGDQYGGQTPGAPSLSETAPQVPSSPYARSKQAVERLGLEANKRGANVVATRSFNHTGPGQDDRFVAPSFARQAAEIAAGARAPRMTVGNLESVRDFLHVDDVIDAYTALLDPSVPRGVYNVASGVPHTIQELLDGLLAHAGVSPEVTVDPDLVRPTDQLLGDAKKLRDATGWLPERGFSGMVAALAADWSERVR